MISRVKSIFPSLKNEILILEVEIRTGSKICCNIRNPEWPKNLFILFGFLSRANSPNCRMKFSFWNTHLEWIKHLRLIRYSDSAKQKLNNFDSLSDIFRLECLKLVNLQPLFGTNWFFESLKGAGSHHFKILLGTLLSCLHWKVYSVSLRDMTILDCSKFSFVPLGL